MKIKQLRELGPAGLKEKQKELEEESFNLRFQTKLGEVDNPLRRRTVRRELARVKTLLREAELNLSRKENKP